MFGNNFVEGIPDRRRKPPMTEGSMRVREYYKIYALPGQQFQTSGLKRDPPLKRHE